MEGEAPKRQKIDEMEPSARWKKNRSYQLPPHPYGVKPMGNQYLDSSNPKSSDHRINSLGHFCVLDDELIIFLLSYLDLQCLGRMLCVSKFMYAYGREEELWKDMLLDHWDGNFSFDTTYYKTLANLEAKKKGLEKIEDSVKNTVQFPAIYSDKLFNRWYCNQIDPNYWAGTENIDRVSNLSVEEFIEKYEKPNRPVIITDVVQHWPAFKAWNRKDLIENYGDMTFKTDAGVKMTLKDYFSYCSVQESSPMYLFDNEFCDKAPQLLKDYEVPSYFREDFFSLLTGNDRPSFRWILIGPPKSGSGFHKDPNCTSAWNGVISGRKKWIFFPPNIVPPGVFPSEDGFKVMTPESVVEWFADFYAEVKANKDYQPIECIQKTGELVFVPAGWWHTAFNLEETIAVTQNVVSSQNLGRVVAFLKSKHSQELYSKLAERVKEKRPDLAAVHFTEPKKKTSLWAQITGKP